MAGGRTSQQRIQALLERGLTSLDAGRYDEALQNWNEVLALDPRHERAQRLVSDLKALMAAERGDPPVPAPVVEDDPISGEFVVFVDDAKPTRPAPPPPPPGALARGTRPMRATEENALVSGSSANAASHDTQATTAVRRPGAVSEELAAVMTTSVSKSAIGRLRRLVESQAEENQSINTQLSDARTENLHLREELNRRERSVIDLRDKLLDLEKKFAALDDERRDADRSRNQRERHDAEFEARAAELAERARLAAERVAELEMHLVETQARLDEEAQEHAATRALLDDAHEQLGDLSDNIEASQATSTEFEAKAMADEAAREQLRAEVADLREQLAQADAVRADASTAFAERDALRDELERVRSELASTREMADNQARSASDVSANMEKFAALESRLAGAELVAVHARAQVVDRDNQLAERDALLAERDRHIASFTTRTAELEEQLQAATESNATVAAAANARVAEIEAERDNLLAALNEAEADLAEVDKLLAERDSAIAQAEELELMLTAVGNRVVVLEPLEAEVSRLNNEYNGIRAELEGAQSAAATLRGQLESTQDASTAVRADLEAARAAAAQLSARCDELEATVAAITAERDQTQTDLAATREAIVGAAAHAASVEAAAAVVRAERDAVIAAQSGNAAELSEYRARVAMLEATLKELTDAADMALQDISKLRAERDANRGELSSRSELLRTATMELEGLHAESTRLGQQIRERDAQLAAANSAVGQLRAERDQARTEAHAAAESIGRTTSELEQARHDARTAREAINARDSELEMLRNAFGALTEQAAVLEEAKAAAWSETAALANRIADLEGALETSERERSEARGALSDHQRKTSATRSARGIEVTERINELEALVDRMAQQIRATARLTNPSGEHVITESDILEAQSGDPTTEVARNESPRLYAPTEAAPALEDNFAAPVAEPGDTPVAEPVEAAVPTDFATTSALDDTPVEAVGRRAPPVAEEPALEFSFTGENASVEPAAPATAPAPAGPSPRERLSWMIDEVPRVLNRDLGRIGDLGSRAVFVLQTIDGSVSYADILDLISLPPDETAGLLIDLVDRGMIASPSTSH